MKISIISFTQNGEKLGLKIKEGLKGCDIELYPKNKIEESLYSITKKAFEESNAIVFISAAGIAVRAIAPFLESKDKDPAVVVCDELGKFAIPILSGHIGGANELAENISAAVGSIPVITTATDINGIWAADVWAVKNNFKVHNIQNIKYISSALLRGDKVGLTSDVDIDLNEIPKYVLLGENNTEYGIVISPYLKKTYKYTLNIIPKCIHVGIGSRKNSDINAPYKLLLETLKYNSIALSSVKDISTIDIKANEPSILKLCSTLGLKLKTYRADELNSVSGDFSGSDFVKKITGTDNVCERCAVLSSNGGQLLIKKQACDGVTIALAIDKEVCNNEAYNGRNGL